ncbi:EamA family transporter [Rhizobiales bacterium]|uniref:DMT family transporter n=1 Tax=Hongsoonwoonella zoysiae TaxID=2821844 RepID=UPI00155F795F|nr:EamA family transporter [Hongsoonwoonella zoysiae]NRG17673.1 EamA family transporter [Hongsoonwoonella zoysiae]
MSRQSQRAYTEIGLLVLLSFLWGSSFTLIEFAIDTIPPATMVFGRLSIGASLLMLMAFWSGAAFPRSPSRWGHLLVQGILQSALPFTLISWGQQHIDSGLAGLLNTTPPLFVFLIGFFLLKDRSAGLQQFAGILLGFAGVLVIMGPAALAGEESSVAGQLAVIGASLSYATAALYARRFSDQSPVVTAACSMTFAALVMLPLSAWADDPLSLSPPISSVAAVIGLGVFSTALAMTIYFRLVRTLGPLGVATGGYMRAAFSVLLGALLLGEALTGTLLLGLVTIFAGVAIVTGFVKLPARKTAA